MSDAFSSQLSRVAGKLVLALVNATLILVVLALFLGLRLAGTMERVAEASVAAAMAQATQFTPLRDEIAGLREQISGLRDDLTSLPGDTTGDIAERITAVSARLDRIEARLAEVGTDLAPTLDAVSADPGIVVDRAVRTGIEELGRWLAPHRGCTMPERV